MIKGLIFDLDGTLLDTITDLGNSVNEVLKDYNFPIHSIDEYKLMVGHGFKDLVFKALPDNHKDKIEDALNKFLIYYNQKYTETSKPYPGIIELLTILQNKGLLLAVNSNKRNDYTNTLIKHNFPNIHFVEILGETNGIDKKPSAMGANIIIQKMNLNKDEVLYIGDSSTDMKTALNAGVKSVGCDWGFRGTKELKENNATHIIYKPIEILPLIK